jgi:hypothetical protein
VKKLTGTAGCLAAVAALCGAPAAWADVTNINTSEVFTTIQAAINDSDTLHGHVLVVDDGTYAENVSITKNITLRSVNGRGSTTIQGSPGTLGTIRVAPGANGVTIGGPGQGFTIIGYDNPTPGLETAAVYLQGAHSNVTVEGNEIVAMGDSALLTEWGAAISNLTINDNIFSGQTFVGPAPGGPGDQFSVPNMPRALVFIGCGNNCTSTNGVTFTNNVITGTSGGVNGNGPQGNMLVNIDAMNVTVSGNTFAGTTTGFAAALRARGSNTTITGNTFDGSGQTATSSYMTLPNTTSLNGLSTYPASLAAVRDANTFSPPALILPAPPDTLFIGFNNLGLEIGDCPDDYDASAGYQIAVELWMRGLNQNVSGYAAFLEFNPMQLSYRPDLSSYTGPFGLHVTNIGDAEVAGGKLEVNGAILLGDPSVPPDDYHLATLVFDVNVQCAPLNLTFDTSGPFSSVLSLKDSALPTPLFDAPGVTLDDEPPVLTAPDNGSIACPTEIPAAATTISEFLALSGADATDNCTDPEDLTLVSAVDGAFVGDVCAGGTITRTYTIADACGNASTVDHVFDVLDDAPPVVSDPDPVTIQCSSNLPAAATTIAGFLALPGADASDNCSAQGSLTVTHADDDSLLVNPCQGTIVRVYTIYDTCGNSSFATQTFTVNDTTPPAITCPPAIFVDADAGGCEATLSFVDTFDNAVPVCATQTPNCWYVDRYAPAGFGIANFDGGSRLKHSITSAGAWSGRTGGFLNIFYNTQGRKHDVNLAVGSKLQVDLYIGSDWATESRRADIWATARDSSGAISGYPIIGFISNDPTDATTEFNPDPADADIRTRLRVWRSDTGMWVELLPHGSVVLGQWYTMSIELTASAFVYEVRDESNTVVASYVDTATGDAVRLSDVMLQAYNFTNATYPAGSNYDVYWDNLHYGPKGPVATDNCGVASVTAARADAQPLDAPYPQGATTVIWTVTDCSGNSVSCNQTVNVSDRNQVQATVELAGVDAGAGLTRCIRFTPRNGMVCGDTEYVEVQFTGNPAVGVASFDVECGDWTELCVKDEQHTLISTGSLVDAGATYVTAAPISLNGGDTDNDSDVDINDLTWLIFQFGTAAPLNASCDPWNAPDHRSADFSGDGLVGTEDYTFIVNNWLTFSSCDCGALATGGKGKSLDMPLADSIQLSAMSAEFPPEVAGKVDVNRDGVIDVRDVEQFEMKHHLSGELSAKLRNAMSAQPAAAPAGKRK